MVDGSIEGDHAELWRLGVHSFSTSGQPSLAVHERSSPALPTSHCSTTRTRKEGFAEEFLHRKSHAVCGAPDFVTGGDPKSNSRNARMIQVRHRSYATYSRQPRQVRKEATVTGSCVCSEPPVPDLIFFTTSLFLALRFPQLARL